MTNWAAVVRDALTMLRRLRRDPRVPWTVKAALGGLGLYLLSPIDLIPDFIPVLGALDDVFLAGMVLRFATRRVPRQAFVDAWPGDPKMLERLLRGG